MRDSREGRFTWLGARIVGAGLVGFLGLAGPALDAGASPAVAAVGDWRGVIIAPPGVNLSAQVDDGWVVCVNQASLRPDRRVQPSPRRAAAARRGSMG